MYKKFYLTPGKQAPFGSTGKTLSDGGIVWIGESDNISADIESYVMSDAEVKQFKQAPNKEACKAHILARYPVEIQLSMNAGVYPAAEFEVYQTFLAACIAEENRVFDLIEADVNSTVTPVWPEV